MADTLCFNKKLVYIVGSQRSGTTWLQMMLAESEYVATGPETYLFSGYLRSAMESWTNLPKQGVGLSSVISEADFKSWASALAISFFSKIAAGKPSAEILVDKTPDHSGYGREILWLFPESYFVHVIRDPRSVVASMRAASSSWGEHWAPRQIKTACAIWRRGVQRARRIGGYTSRYREVFYEKLHADPAREVVRLFEWLGQTVSRSEAEQYAKARSLDMVRSVTASKEDIDKQFFRRGEVDSWREELTGPEIAMIERLTRKQMSELGYEPIAKGLDRILAAGQVGAYLAANKFAQAARSGADRIKP